jgi:hypothetical protein
MPNHTESEVVRNRIYPYVADDILRWIRECCLPGGPFASDGHAMEVALQRLFEEHRFIRDECKRAGIKFNAPTFWSFYTPFIEAARPTPAGRPVKGQARVVVERQQTSAGIDVRLQKWLDELVKQGHFESPNHVIEAALRYLQSLDQAPRWAGQGFPMDAAARWKHYQDAI